VEHDKDRPGSAEGFETWRGSSFDIGPRRPS